MHSLAHALTCIDTDTCPVCCASVDERGLEHAQQPMVSERPDHPLPPLRIFTSKVRGAAFARLAN
jgi:hypothetical protein